MPPSDAGGGAGGSFFAGHQAATDNGSSSDSMLSFMRNDGREGIHQNFGARARANCLLREYEYLVNTVLGRRTAEERVTGGRWRRIVLGDVLAEHVVELRGRARVWPER